MKIYQLSNIFSVLTILTLSAVSCKVIVEPRSSSADSIDNVSLVPEPQRGPFLTLLSNMEEFVETSIHNLVDNLITSNTSMLNSLPEMLASPLHTFHNFTVHMEDLGDTIFKRQEGIIHLVQCECPDEQNKCNHILARKIPETFVVGDKRDAKKRELKDDEPALPVVDVITLIRHFQRHFTNVLQTQRKVFEYAQCACPNKKECLRSKEASNPKGWFRDMARGNADAENDLESDENEGNQQVFDEDSDDSTQANNDSPQNNGEAVKDIKRSKRSSEPNISQYRGYFDDFLAWFTHYFSSFPRPESYTVTNEYGTILYNSTYPNGTLVNNATSSSGTQMYNGTLPNGAQVEGGEYHNGNGDGYFVSTHKNNSNGNSFSSSSSSSSSFSGGSSSSFGGSFGSSIGFSSIFGK